MAHAFAASVFGQGLPLSGPYASAITVNNTGYYDYQIHNAYSNVELLPDFLA
jgi:hypothetical protein